MDNEAGRGYHRGGTDIGSAGHIRTAMKKEKGKWVRDDIPSDYAERQKLREGLGLDFNREYIDTLIQVNRSRPEICQILITDEKELDAWSKENYYGFSWSEYYQNRREFYVGEAKKMLAKLAQAGHVKAMEFTLKDLVDDDSDAPSNRITIKMDIGTGDDEK